MKRITKTFLKSFFVWPLCLMVLVPIQVFSNSIIDGKFVRTLSDPDWIGLPLFVFLIYLVPNLVAALTFSVIAVSTKKISSWAVFAAAVASFGFMFAFEFLTQPYFKSGITEEFSNAAQMAFGFLIASFVSWRAIRNDWHTGLPT